MIYNDLTPPLAEALGIDANTLYNIIRAKEFRDKKSIGPMVSTSVLNNDLTPPVMPPVIPKNTDRQCDIGNLLRKNCYIYRRKVFTFFTRYTCYPVRHLYISSIFYNRLSILTRYTRNIIDGFYRKWFNSLCFGSIIIAVFCGGVASA